MLNLLRPLAFHALANLIAPLRCASCDTLLRSRALFCSDCATSVDPCPTNDSPLAIAYYGGAISSALLRLKYANRPDIAYRLGELMRNRLACLVDPLHPIDLVVPVPVPPSRLIERGYNQAALIAASLVPSIAKQFAPRALGRHESQFRQAELNRQQRLDNLRDAFFVQQPERLNHRSVLLIDDVCTTGATLHSCQTCLASAGAELVAIAVVARVP